MSFHLFILNQISNPAGSKDSQTTKPKVFSAVWKIRVGYRCEYFGNLTCQISVMAVNHQCCSQTRADTTCGRHSHMCPSLNKSSWSDRHLPVQNKLDSGPTREIRTSREFHNLYGQNRWPRGAHSFHWVTLHTVTSDLLTTQITPWGLGSVGICLSDDTLCSSWNRTNRRLKMSLKICELLILQKGHPVLLLQPIQQIHFLWLFLDVEQNVCTQTLKEMHRSFHSHSCDGEGKAHKRVLF